MPQVKDDWSQAMATKLRAQSEKERADMENNLEKTIDQAWNKAKDGVRKDWENQDNEPPTIS